MAVTKGSNLRKDQDNGKSLKGTLFSVGFVAAVIVVMWVAVFWIYMERI